MSINTGSTTNVNGTPYAVYNGGNLRNGTVLGQVPHRKTDNRKQPSGAPSDGCTPSPTAVPTDDCPTATY
jgi:hypothetical protein